METATRTDPFLTHTSHRATSAAVFSVTSTSHVVRCTMETICLPVCAITCRRYTYSIRSFSAYTRCRRASAVECLMCEGEEHGQALAAVCTSLRSERKSE